MLPRRSSHQLKLLSAMLPWAAVPERLVRPLGVVPLDPPTDRSPRLREADEVALPDALLLQAAEEALDDPVLLRRVRRDELLAERR